MVHTPEDAEAFRIAMNYRMVLVLQLRLQELPAFDRAGLRRAQRLAPPRTVCRTA